MSKKQDSQLASIIYSFDNRENYNKYLSNLQTLKQISVEVVKNPNSINCLKLSYNGEILPVRKGVMNGNGIELDIQKHSDISFDEISKTGAYFCTTPFPFCRTAIIFQLNDKNQFVSYFTFSAADFIDDLQYESAANDASINYINNFTSIKVQSRLKDHKNSTLPSWIYREKKDGSTEMRSYKNDGEYLVLSTERTSAKTFGEFIEEMEVTIRVIAANACDSFNK